MTVDLGSRHHGEKNSSFSMKPLYSNLEHLQDSLNGTCLLSHLDSQSTEE